MEILLILLAVAFYFLPTIVGGKKRNGNAIFTLNLLLGWSVIGWVVAMVWATTAEAPAAPQPSSAARLAQLKTLRDAGTLTQEEFMEQVRALTA